MGEFHDIDLAMSLFEYDAESTDYKSKYKHMVLYEGKKLLHSKENNL